jgi:hypothetical protein
MSAWVRGDAADGHDLDRAELDQAEQRERNGQRRDAALLPSALIWGQCYNFCKLSPKKIGEIIGIFFTQNTASLCKKNWIGTLVFKKNAIFSDKKWRKSQETWS